MLTGEQLSERQAVGDRAHDGLGRVAKNVGSHAEHVIKVRVAVDVDQLRAVTGAEKKRDWLTTESEVAADTAGERSAGLVVQLDRTSIRRLRRLSGLVLIVKHECAM
ncbi:MAG: hypothetical protein JOZ87_18600 [Chloroflexi bacterium]|nr:hypothetical protein [Chloroflexota bacterium]